MSVTQCPECGGYAAMKEASHFVCQDCGWDNQKPAKRARTSDAKNDIENAFHMWRIANNSVPDDVFAEEERAALDAQDRVKTWLTQVSADQRQLHAALLACQAVMEAAKSMEDDPQEAWLREAVKLARAALETKSTGPE